MRQATIAAALMLAGLAVPAQPEEPPSETDAYRSLKQERIEAYRDRDRARMERILAPDFFALGPDGRHLDRAHYLAAEFPPEAVAAPAVETEVSNFSAKRVGSTLVLSYDETERTDVAGQPFVVNLARLDVYVRLDGEWRLQTMSAVRRAAAPQPIDLPAERLAEYAGVYRYGPAITSSVRLEGGHLVEQSTGNPPSELVPVGPDEFYAPPDNESRTLFERDAQGRVVAQLYRSGGQTLRAELVGEAAR